MSCRGAAIEISGEHRGLSCKATILDLNLQFTKRMTARIAKPPVSSPLPATAIHQPCPARPRRAERCIDWRGDITGSRMGDRAVEN
ncbi:hypothetical protein RRF57_005909 [Xylaria bambusicola]|uniref:Uncharacterized protein n=1 Tax=Xylaria bambusicola TaxID=326684 RepID=A0AAN7UR58_9PEZI